MTVSQNIQVKEDRALRPDAQAFDEIRLITVPRYKESELSGDEWRISVAVEFYRGGQLHHTSRHVSDIQVAIMMLGSFFYAASETNAYFAGEGEVCDQEGCSNPWNVKYKRKASYDRSGTKSEIDETRYISTRCFCNRHKTRGDCGLDDADTNYELIETR